MEMFYVVKKGCGKLVKSLPPTKKKPRNLLQNATR